VRSSSRLLGLIFLFACGSGSDPLTGPPDPASLRTLREGPVVGFAHPRGGHAWLGIPFAKPPVAELRWRAPRPPAPWRDTRQALAFGPSCSQLAGPAASADGARDGEPAGSEDCLYLNVFAPRFRPDDVPRGAARLPVMMWIHGGGNTIGDARLYDGSTLATTRDVIVVTVHYRLGVFGWFSHPALRGEGTSPDDASGNYATLDLVRALHWLRDNAAAFGGDPGRVTIFGESAGGVNVFSLLLSPRAAGLFQRAIVQSGGLSLATLAEAEHLADEPEAGHERSSREILLELLQREGRADGRAEAKRALAAMSDVEIAAYLRGRDAATLLGLFDGDRLGGMYDVPLLFPDGHVLPREEPLAAFAAGAYNRVPTILGTNRDESKLFMAFGSPHVSRIFGLPLRINDPRRYDLEAEYGSRLWKAVGVDEPAEAMRRAQGATVFGYRFDWDGERKILWLDLGRLLGAAHGMEVPFVFGELSFFGMRGPFDEAQHERDLALSRAMTSYWTQFALAGDPGRGRQGELPRWEPWSRDAGHKYVLLDTDDGGGIRMASEPVTRAEVIDGVASDPRFASDGERCAVWASFVQWTDEMTPEDYARAGDGICAAHPLDDG
jgi:para-nitrobenzyl esterase